MSRINSNISSLQAIHSLQRNQQDLTLRLQRLSTGLRINSGRDDPAGLIASEGLRAELRGLSQAIENSSRALNVFATAEAALGEVNTLLLDIQELVSKSANEGALSASELEANQLQIDSLLESIDRIANGTVFGGNKLLNGHLDYTLSGVATSAFNGVAVFGARVGDSAFDVSVEVLASAETAQVRFTGAGLAVDNNVSIAVAGNRGTEVFNFAGSSSVDDIAATINSFADVLGVSATTSANGLFFSSTAYGSEAFVSVTTLDGDFTITDGDAGGTRDFGVDPTVLINGQAANSTGLRSAIRSSGLDLVLELTADRATTLGTSTFGITGGGTLFQIGPEVNPAGQVSIGIPSVGTGNLGNPTVGFLNSLGGGRGNSVIDGNYAEAQGIVKESINQVAVIRGRLGGIQRNQIETNIRSQQIAFENVQASESAIRDADYAVEVAALTRAQILVQSTTQSLLIANTIPQNVLALLG